MTNSIFLDIVKHRMIFHKLTGGLRRPFGYAQGKEKRARARRDVLVEQVKKVLTDADQKLILMVRG